MKRAALLVFPAAALLGLLAVQHADARSKAYCRDWAQTIADRNAGPSEQAPADGIAMVGAVTDGQGNELAPAAADPAGNAMMTPAPGNDHWQEIYHRAYADCRAS